jgi:hypothetical protein
MPPYETPSAEDIARHYAAMLDSVTTITAALASDDPDRADAVRRNAEHLQMMLKRDWWAGYNLAPMQAAISAGEGV